MRTGILVWIFLFSCAALAVQAQEQEATLGKLLQTRNVDVAPTLFQNKSFLDGGAYGGLHSANVKSFFLGDGFRTKEFATNQFFGTNDHWSGYFKFDTKQANLNNRSTFVDASKTFETKAAPTKTAMESGKEYATRTFETRDFRGKEVRGIAQDRLDREGPMALAGPNPLPRNDTLHVMTIDEVRDLLNKGK